MHLEYNRKQIMNILTATATTSHVQTLTWTSDTRKLLFDSHQCITHNNDSYEPSFI